MILSIGEILVDIFESEETKTVFPGGAPFNVACNILKFNTKSSFYGVVGNDEYGKLLTNFVDSLSFENRLIKTLDKHKTTIALVTLKDGERSFRFIRDNGADYQLNIKDLEYFDLSKVNIIHFGSLMLSTLQGRTFLVKAIKYIKRYYRNIKLSFDVNFRDDIYKSNDVAIKIYKKFIPYFDILKFSNDEIVTLSSISDVDKGLNKLIKPEQIVFVTFGKEGSKLYHQGNVYSSSSIKIKPVDTTGAGDAFYSYILSELDKNDINKLTQKDIETILFKANCVGAIATLKKGAINVAPSLEELDKFLKENTDEKK